MNKDLIEDKLYHLLDKFSKRKINHRDFYFVLLGNRHPFCRTISNEAISTKAHVSCQRTILCRNYFYKSKYYKSKQVEGLIIAKYRKERNNHQLPEAVT